MKIENSSILLSSQYKMVEKYSVKESVRIWIGDRRPNFEEQGSPNLTARIAVTDFVTLSGMTQASQSIGKIASDDEDDVALTPELRMIKMIIERMIGREINLGSVKAIQDKGYDAKGHDVEPQAEPRQGYGVEYDYHESYYESEKVSFSAKGVINTADGEKINFSVKIRLRREFMIEQNISARFGDAVTLKDPLVINFGGTSAQLTNRRFSFDIDSDGKADRVPFVGANSGFLAIDRNHDGKINNGSELFGPKTGNGFAELAEYDADHNNWIDENDSIYSKLRVWSKDARGNNSLVSLKQRGVGAIYLGHQYTQFKLNDAQNKTQGQLRASGIYVNERGTVGTIQQVDLST